MQTKTYLNLKGKETFALIALNLLVIMGLVIFYVLVLRNRNPEMNNDVLGTTTCASDLNYVKGIVFQDANTNGTKEASEAGIADVKVKLRLSDGSSSSAVTDSTGNYKICVKKNLPASVEFMSDTFPSGYFPGPKGPDSKSAVVFFSTNSNQTISLGLVTTGSNVIEIGDRVWNDTNSNGIQDPGEPGIDGVKVVLYDAIKNTKIGTVTTSGGGMYYFNSRNFGQLKGNNTYKIMIEASEFATGKRLDGFVTTAAKRGNDGALDSDTREGQTSAEISVVIGEAETCNVCFHNYDIGVRNVRTPSGTPTGTPTSTPTSSSTPTNTPTSSPTPTTYVEPGFPACTQGTRIGTYSGMLIRTGDPKVLTHTFNLSGISNVRIEGVVKEGHPEAGCPSSNPSCNQNQANESFKMELDGTEFGRYLDRGPEVNAWTEVGPWNFSNVSSGSHELKFSHLLLGNTPESVDYKFSVCVVPVSTTTPTSTPTSTSTPTDSPTPTSTRIPSGSPTNTPTSTPTSTDTPSNTPTSTPTGEVSGTGTGRNPNASGTPTGDVLGANDTRLPATGLNDNIMILVGSTLVLLGANLVYILRKRAIDRVK